MYEVTGEWRKLHNKELHILYSSPNIIRADQVKDIQVGGICGMHGGGEECVRGFYGKARRKETTWEIKA
jgi:hypothetical protein